MAGSSTLSDLRVIECADGVAGPYCGKLLADLGADVVKVEPPAGDSSRRFGPFAGDRPHLERSGQFLYLNSNKRGITLDLEHAAGIEVLTRLAADADVLILDRPRSQLEALGIDVDALREANEGLVVTVLTPYGFTGPYKDWAGNAHTVYQMSGMGRETPSGYVTDLEHEPPLSPGNPQADYLTGVTAATSTMVAITYRRVYGGGQ
ncbi:MAG: CoA transferase, partial [Chloroflexi bacterium]|nr:CoA transferase [Chloroflexota bacterium]